MSLPPSEIPQGAIRFNTDSQRLEVYAQEKWWIISTSNSNLCDPTAPGTPGTRGIFAGGYAPSPVGYSAKIDYINITSVGNSLEFGDLSAEITGGGGCSSSTRGLFAGGYVSGSPFSRDQIDFVTIASKGDGQDFGDLANGQNIRRGSVGNATRGTWAGGQSSPQNALDSSIHYVTLASTGDSNNFGDLTQGRTRFSGAGDRTRGVMAGGFSGAPSVYWDTIDFITISTLGDAQDFGDLLAGKSWTASCSNSTRMLIGGGYTNPLATSEIEYIEIQSGGNALRFGDLNQVVDTGTYANGGVSSSTRGVFNTGLFTNPSATYHNTIYYVQIATVGRATDFGDLSEKRYGAKTCSNGHGGL